MKASANSNWASRLSQLWRQPASFFARQSAHVRTRFWDTSGGALAPTLLADWKEALKPATALQADADYPEVYYGDISVFANEPAFEYLCRRVLCSGENVLPDFEFFDWTMTPKPDGHRNMRFLPTSVAGEAEQSAAEIVQSKTRFCAFVYNNPFCAERNRLFELLSQHRRVDALGFLMRNAAAPKAYPRFRDDWFDGAVEMQRAYKFVVSFESTFGEGYTSEKICVAFRANAVPIYWGNPQIMQDYRRGSFINAHDFSSLEDLADHVLKVDADEKLYQSYLAAPRLSRSLYAIYDDQIARRRAFLRTIHTASASGEGAPVGQTDMFQREICSRLHCKTVERIIASAFARFDKRPAYHYFEGMTDS